MKQIFNSAASWLRAILMGIKRIDLLFIHAWKCIILKLAIKPVLLVRRLKTMKLSCEFP